MGDTKLNDYPARLGDKQLVVVDHTGPTSYTTGGETLGNINPQTGVALQGIGSLDLVLGGAQVSVSGNYWVLVQPTGSGSRKTWKLLWFTATAGVPSLTQVTAAVNLSAETVKLGYVGR